MKPAQLLRAILPDVLIDNFDIVNFDKSADRFDIYLDEKKVQLKEDKTNPDIISYGFGEYRTIQDYPIRGRATYLHVRKRKWLDKSSNEIFSYDWDLSEFGLSRFLAGIIFYTREVLLTSHYEKRLFEHASQPRVACADIRLLSYLWSRTNLSRDSYQSG